MKAIKLMRELIEVIAQNPNAEVYLDNGEAIRFSGFSVDDNNEVLLYVETGNEPA